MSLYQYEFVRPRMKEFLPEVAKLCTSANLNQTVPINEAHLRDMLAICSEWCWNEAKPKRTLAQRLLGIRP